MADNYCIELKCHKAEPYIYAPMPPDFHYVLSPRHKAGASRDGDVFLFVRLFVCLFVCRTDLFFFVSVILIFAQSGLKLIFMNCQPLLIYIYFKSVVTIAVSVFIAHQHTDIQMKTA